MVACNLSEAEEKSFKVSAAGRYKFRVDLTGEKPVVDVIDNALGMINDESVAQGVKMISRELENLMSTYGVTEIKALGKPFDPELHEAILRVPAEHEDMSGNVMEVFRKGYMIGDKVLRHSVVKVAE